MLAPLTGGRVITHSLGPKEAIAIVLQKQNHVTNTLLVGPVSMHALSNTLNNTDKVVRGKTHTHSPPNIR